MMERNENERVERLLTLLLLRDMEEETQEKKVKFLNLAGLSNFEIGEFLGVNPNVIANYLYKSKKKKIKSKKK